MESSKTYPIFLRNAVEQFSANVAIESGENTISYSEFGALSDVLASRLPDEQVYRKPVAVCFAKSFECYLSQIAVMKAGGFYVPIDPTYPPDRIEHILSDSNSEVVLTSEDSQDNFGDRTVIRVSKDALEGGKNEERSRINDVGKDDFAYMIYTSGSTGMPKGVPIHHEAIVNHNLWFRDAVQLSEQDRLVQFASVSFDFSIEEILPTFLSGATMVIPQEEALRTTADFIAWIGEQRITVLNLPTAYWHEIVHTLKAHPLPRCVRLVAIGGERVCPNRVAQWFEHRPPGVPLINAYGPTETTITSSVSTLEPGQPITIGKPITGMDYEVRDEDFSSVKSGNEGELVISGVGVARGYWERPELTAERFVKKGALRYYRTGDKVLKNSDGNYVFRGRIDEQVKIRGYRIEPGEIAATMSLHSGVAESIVRPIEKNGSTELAGYYLPVEDQNVDPEELRECLGDQLPHYMIPRHLVEIDSIPQTSGGKIDYSSLPAPDSEDKPFVGRCPETDEEKTLSSIWEVLLGEEVRSVDDDFFKGGGDSLKAMRLVLQIEERFNGLRIPIAVLAEHSTVESLAAFIGQQCGSIQAKAENSGEPSITVINRNSDLIPIFAFHGSGGGGLFFKNFEACLSNRHPFHIFESGALYQKGPVDIVQSSIEQIAEVYTKHLLENLEGSEVILTGYSLGGSIAFEIGRRLTGMGIKIDTLINIDAPTPDGISKSEWKSVLHRSFRLLINNPRSLYFRLLSRFEDQASLRQIRKASGDLSGELRSKALEELYNALEEQYNPKKWACKMSLIVSTEEEIFETRALDYGWGRVVSDLKIIQVPGSHQTMLDPGNLSFVEDAFRKCFEGGHRAHHYSAVAKSQDKSQGKDRGAKVRKT